MSFFTTYCTTVKYCYEWYSRRSVIRMSNKMKNLWLLREKLETVNLKFRFSTRIFAPWRKLIAGSSKIRVFKPSRSSSRTFVARRTRFAKRQSAHARREWGALIVTGVCQNSGRSPPLAADVSASVITFVVLQQSPIITVTLWAEH